MTGFQVWGVEGLPEVEEGDDISAMIAERAELIDGDIIVVTSKIISKAEGRVISAVDREQAITAETVRVVASRDSTRIVENRLGIIAAAAGVDSSNTTDGTVLLLPVDPDASARAICAKLREHTGSRVGVLVSDTLGRPWRLGQTDVAIGAAGVVVLDDLRGSVDASGRPLGVTVPCVADQICSASELVRPKSAAVPVAIVRGLERYVGGLDLPGAQAIIRSRDEDMFSLGTQESWDAGYQAAMRAVTGLTGDENDSQTQ